MAEDEAGAGVLTAAGTRLAPEGVMNIALRRRMTVEEFLAWDEGQEERWEFDGFAPVAMTGGTRAHSLITTNIIRAVGNHLEGTPCFVYNGDLKVRVAESIRYPDAFVACGAAENKATVSDDPVVVFEVLPPSTSSTDQIVKSYEYSATASIKRYIMVAQDRIAAKIEERRGNEWISTATVDPGKVLDMPEIGLSVPLIEFYKGVLEAP